MLRFLYSLLVVLFFLSHSILGQNNHYSSDAISDCSGAINILEPGTFSIQFTGTSGYEQDIKNYSSLHKVVERNSVWCTFIAPFDGFVMFEANSLQTPLQMVVFKQERDDICEEIHSGLAEIRRLIDTIGVKAVGLSREIDGSHLYALELKEGEKISILFNSMTKNKELLKLKFQFDAKEDPLARKKDEVKIVDLREDEFSPAYQVKIRDAKTGLSVIGNLTIEGLDGHDVLYIGSDFFFEVKKTSNVTIKCDAKGYFFNDKEDRFFAHSDVELTIWLEPIQKGKSFNIEKIEFHPGTSDFMPSSEPKLRRLKDFMALNSEVRIEIQGHVFSPGENSVAGQKMSEARAKRVYNYLVDNGINKTRMETKGYGNTKPIYPTPRLSYEEQMNRRVEVKIL